MDKTSPLVSVIVTTYNRKILLKETINSILCQTFKDFELIVVDNYSDYDFYNFIDSFNDNRILPFQNNNNGNIALNRNHGIKKAKDLGLDLVEISPNAKPPICKILAF